MYKKLIPMLALSAMISACQTFPTDTNTGQTNLIMTNNVSKSTGHAGIKSQFAYGESVNAYLTLYADVANPPKVLEATWYNEGKVVVKKAITPHIKRQPHFVWFSINSSEIGSGASKVEIRADGQLLKAENFVVLKPVQ